MKKEFIQTIKIVIIGLLLSVGVSYVSGLPFWENAVGVPGEEAVGEPINISSGEQTKTGTLMLSNGVGTAKLSTDLLHINYFSYFGGKVDIGKKFYGFGGFGGVIPDSTPDTNLSVTGHLAANLDEIGLPVTASVQADGTMRLRPLSQEDNPGIPYDAKICANADGTLILCDGAFSAMFNSSYVAITDAQACDLEKISLTAVPANGLEPYSATWSISAPSAETDPTSSGTEFSHTYTLYKNVTTTYTATVSATIDDSDPDIDPITITYSTVVPKMPAGYPNPPGPDVLCAD